MIYLHLPNKSHDPHQWQTRLKDWCAAHEVIENPLLTAPEIREGSKKICGSDAINQFLSEYRAFMDDWYDCRCDKWLDAPGDS